MYLELLKAYNDLTPQVSDTKEIKAVKFQIRQRISRCIDKLQKHYDSKWHTMEDTPDNEYYFVSGKEEGEMGVSRYDGRHWKEIYNLDGEEVEFPIMAWMELPLWFDWEEYEEKEPTEEELRQQAEDYYWDLKIDASRGK